MPSRWTSTRRRAAVDGSVIVVGGGACGQSFAQPYIDFLAGQPGPT